MSRNFRLSCLVTMATILLGSCVSSRHIDRSSRSQTGRINKRDVGLEHCKLHPRNCPGGFLDKRGRALIEKLQLLYPHPTYKSSETVDESDGLVPLEGLESNTRSTLSSTEDRLGKQLLNFLMSENVQSYNRRGDMW